MVGIIRSVNHHTEIFNYFDLKRIPHRALKSRQVKKSTEMPILSAPTYIPNVNALILASIKKYFKVVTTSTMVAYEA